MENLRHARIFPSPVRFGTDTHWPPLRAAFPPPSARQARTADVEERAEEKRRGTTIARPIARARRNCMIFGAVPMPTPRPANDLGPAGDFGSLVVEAARAAGEPQRERWDHPLAIGLGLMLAPPLGLAMLWSSRHFDRTGRWVVSAGAWIYALSLLVALLAR